MTTKSKGIKGAFFLYKQFFFGNLFYLFSNGKIQFELWEEKDQRLNLVTPVYMNNDHLEAFKKKTNVILKPLLLRCGGIDTNYLERTIYEYES